MYFTSPQPNLGVLAIVFGSIAIILLVKTGSILVFLAVFALLGLVYTSIWP